jgi:hypothetical protein
MFSQIAVVICSTIAAETRISWSVWRSSKATFTSRIKAWATSIRPIEQAAR